jgi:L-lactate dehydrogenase complex protein LldG
MEMAREEILRKLRINADSGIVQEKQYSGFSVYFQLEGDLSEAFKKNNELNSGITSIFDSEEDLFEALINKISQQNLSVISCFEPELREKLSQIGIETVDSLPDNVEAGITSCEFLIANSGSAVVSSAQPGGRQAFVYPPVHIIISSANQIVDFPETAYQKILEKYQGKIPSLITTITGPSRTADIEKTMVYGAHGPKELFIFISKK